MGEGADQGSEINDRGVRSKLHDAEGWLWRNTWDLLAVSGYVDFEHPHCYAGSLQLGEDACARHAVWGS